MISDESIWTDTIETRVIYLDQWVVTSKDSRHIRLVFDGSYTGREF